MRLSYNGNYIVISHPGSIEIVNTQNNQTKKINTEEGSGHYSNRAIMTKDEKLLYQYCDFTASHIYDVNTMLCIDSLPNYPLLPYSFSFTRKGKQYISNNLHTLDLTKTSYLYHLTTDFLVEDTDISKELVRTNIENRITYKLNSNYNVLCYNDGLGNKWESYNAEFLDYTPNLQYIVIVKNGFRGAMEYQILETNSGVCMYKQVAEDIESETLRFLSYNELLNAASAVVKNLTLRNETRKAYYLY